MFSISDRPTINEIHALYREKKAKPSEVVQFFFNRAKKSDKDYNNFVYFCDQSATAKAIELDTFFVSTNFETLLLSHPLFGIPIGLKAIVQMEGEVFDAGSNILKNYKAPYSSTVFEKLDAAGVVVIGINNMDSHAMGSSGETSDHGPSRNPFDTTRTCGGSSCGSAGSVAAGQVVFSIGTDTGGSIRQPAAFTDTVGIKTTYGLISRWGVQPMASSLDQPGPLTNSVGDNLLVTKILSGKDKNDQTSLESSELITKLDSLYELKTNQRCQNKITSTAKPMRIGIVKEFFVDGLDPQIANALDSLKLKLASLGHELVELSIPIIEQAIAIYYLTMSVEVASNLQRIDGVRYANQETEKLQKDKEMYFDHRASMFPSEAKRRIILGSYTSSAGYFDAYYNQSQKVRALAMAEFDKAFEKCDVMLTPTTPEFPFKLGEKSDDQLKMYLSDIFTCLINPIKLPALAVPLGLFEVADSKPKIFDIRTNTEKQEIVGENRRRAVAIIKVAGTDQYVAFKKPAGNTDFYGDSNYYYLAGGKVEDGESALIAAQRETLEEIGLANLKFVKEITICENFSKYRVTIVHGFATYFLFETTQSDIDSRILSELEDKNQTLELVTLSHLRSNDWAELNYVLDVLENKNSDQSTYVKLPTGCQILAPQLCEDRLFELAFEIEKIVQSEGV